MPSPLSLVVSMEPVQLVTGCYGVTLVVNCKVADGLATFAEATLVNLVTVGPQTQGRLVHEMTISDDSLSASYELAAGDVTIDGNLEWHVEATYPEAFLLSEIQLLYVNPTN